MMEERIDVAVIQETKMLPGDREPYLEGYSLTRRDRPGAVRERGGGLAFAVRKGIGYSKTKLANLQVVEADILNIKGSAGKVLQVVNIYIPPKRVRQAEHVEVVMQDLDRLPKGRDAIWCGDFNTHHPLWDRDTEGDALGEALANWQPYHAERRRGDVVREEGRVQSHKRTGPHS